MKCMIDSNLLVIGEIINKGKCKCPVNAADDHLLSLLMYQWSVEYLEADHGSNLAHT